MGDTIALKGMDKGNTADVTAVKIADNAETGNEYLKPAGGKRYVAVQFQIKPTGTKAYSDSPPGSTKVVDTEGAVLRPDLRRHHRRPELPDPRHHRPRRDGQGLRHLRGRRRRQARQGAVRLDSGFADRTAQWKIG